MLTSLPARGGVSGELLGPGGHSRAPASETASTGQPGGSNGQGQSDPDGSDWVAYLPGERSELEVSLALWRRFLGVDAAEVQEVVGFVRGRPWVGYARSFEEQLKLLRRAQDQRGFAGAYLLCNPIDPRIAERYEPGDFGPATAGRASDKEITSRRAVFIDIDPVRPKGISATAEEREAAFSVAHQVRVLLESRCGKPAVGWGSSGNGFYLVIAIEPVAVCPEQGRRIKRLLDGLQSRFGTAAASIDGTVYNPARLMPAPGTWKRKGAGSKERPHRIASFCCSYTAPSPVPLEVLA